MKISDYISEDAQLYLREVIEDADGNEVFFIGTANAEGLVERVRVVARGNEVEVAAILTDCRRGDVLIHNHPSGILRPSSADNRIASLAGNEGAGFFIINNEATEIFVAVEVALPEKAELVKLAEVENYFVPHGPISKALPGFELREPQLRMLRTVVEAFNDKNVALIEAGTGTGKTLAYLLPAIHWSLANRKRVVISTNTINLQQQLIEKDIPLLRRIFPGDFQAALVKGRSNYVCLRKLHEAVSQPDLLELDNAVQELHDIFEWAQKTEDGSKSDLGTLPSDRVWELIQSESDTTLKNRCPFYKKCFFYKARRRAATADILVANHHLLFADLALRASIGDTASEIAVMPRYDRLILDEAHNIEDVASSYFGVRLSYLGIQRTLNRLFRIRNGKESGLIPFLESRLTQRRKAVPRPLLEQLRRLCKETRECIDSARQLSTQTMEPIFAFVMQSEHSEYNEIKLRLTERVYRDPEWQRLMQPVPLLLKKLAEVESSVAKIIAALKKIPTAFEKEARSMAVDIRARGDRLLLVGTELENVLLQRDHENVRWLEARDSRYGKILHLHSAPIDVAPILQKAVFDRFETVVMTSATLSVGKSFDFVDRRLGLVSLPAERKSEVILPSPFNYQEQVIVGIPTDIPAPNDREFSAQLERLLLESIKASQGRSFVLFTAYSLLNRMYEALRNPLEAMGISLYRQGQESRHQLLQRFRSDIASVLFGTDSFWEGVDVPGQALVQVIIPRLPFRVPSEPVIEARVEAIERAGGNSFLDYTVPQAVLKFKQGFGRLIRSRSDYGAIMLFDKRVVSKSYGRVFIESLPECTMIVGAAATVIDEVAKFLRQKEGRPVVSDPAA